MGTVTPNYGLEKPDHDDPLYFDKWDEPLNDNADKIDAQMKLNADAAAASQTLVDQGKATAKDPVVDATFIIGAIDFYVGRTRVVYAGNPSVDMGTGGAYQTTAITATWYNKALFTINTSGTLVMYEGVAAATAGAVTLPTVPAGEYPIVLVTFQDDGAGGAGTINNLVQGDLADRRPLWSVDELPNILSNQTCEVGTAERDAMYRNLGTDWSRASVTSGNPEKSKAMGIAINVDTANNVCDIVFRGIVDGYTGLTAGSVYYVDTGAGTITTTAPSYKSNERHLRSVVGLALTTTSLYVHPELNFETIDGMDHISSANEVLDGAVVDGDMVYWSGASWNRASNVVGSYPQGMASGVSGGIGTVVFSGPVYTYFGALIQNNIYIIDPAALGQITDIITSDLGMMERVVVGTAIDATTFLVNIKYPDTRYTGVEPVAIGPYIISPSESGKVFTDQGSAGLTDFSLPNEVGFVAHFVSFNSNQLTVTPQPADTITIGNLTTTPGTGFIRCNQPGATISLIKTSPTTWHAVSAPLRNWTVL